VFIKLVDSRVAVNKYLRHLHPMLKLRKRLRAHFVRVVIVMAFAHATSNVLP